MLAALGMAALTAEAVLTPPFLIQPAIAEQGDVVHAGYTADQGKALPDGDALLAHGQRRIGLIVGPDHGEDDVLFFVRFAAVPAGQRFGPHAQTVGSALIEPGGGEHAGGRVGGKRHAEVIEFIRIAILAAVIAVQHQPQLVHAVAHVFAPGVGQRYREGYTLAPGDLSIFIEAGNLVQHGPVDVALGLDHKADRVAVDPDVFVGDVEPDADHQVAYILAVLRGEDAAVGHVAVEARPVISVVEVYRLPLAIPPNPDFLGLDRVIPVLVDRKSDFIVGAGGDGDIGGVAVVHSQVYAGQLDDRLVYHHEADFSVGIVVLVLPGICLESVGVSQAELIRGNREHISRVGVVPTPDLIVVLVLVVDLQAQVFTGHAAINLRAEHQVVAINQRRAQRIAVAIRKYRGVKGIPGPQGDGDGLEGLRLAGVVGEGHVLPFAVVPPLQAEGIPARVAFGPLVPGDAGAIRFAVVLLAVLTDHFNAQPVRAGHIAAQCDLSACPGLVLVRAEGSAARYDAEAQALVIIIGTVRVEARLGFHPNRHTVIPVLRQVAGGQLDLAILRRINLEEAFIAVVHIEDAYMIAGRPYGGMAEVHAQLLSAGQAAVVVQVSQANAGHLNVIAGDGHGDGFAVLPYPFAVFFPLLADVRAHLEGIHATFARFAEADVGEVIVKILIAVERPEAAVEVSEASPRAVPHELDVVIIIPIGCDADMEPDILLGGRGGFVDGQLDALRGIPYDQQLAIRVAGIHAVLVGVHPDDQPVAVRDAVIGQWYGNGVLACFGAIRDIGATIYNFFVTAVGHFKVAFPIINADPAVVKQVLFPAFVANDDTVPAGTGHVGK